MGEMINQLEAAFEGVTLQPFGEACVSLAIAVAEELKARGVKVRPFFRAQIEAPRGRLVASLSANGYAVQVLAGPGCSWDHVPGALVDGLLCRVGEPVKGVWP